MSRLMAWFGIVALAASQSSASAQVAAKTLVEQAVEAHGGGAALVRTKVFIRSAKGEITSFGARASVTLELTYQAPDKGRWAYELGAGGQKVMLAVSGDKGIRFTGGAANQMTKQEMEDVIILTHFHHVIGLVPLLDGSHELTALPEAKVGDAPALGVKVAAKGKPEIKLWFDKKTNLLVKAERPGRQGGIDVTNEYFFSDFKGFDGVKLPGKELEMLNGRKIAEWIISDYKFPQRVDEAMFTKP